MARRKREELQVRSSRAQDVARRENKESGALRARRDESGRAAKPAPIPPILARLAPHEGTARAIRAALGLLKKNGWQPHWLPETERVAAVRAGRTRAKALSLTEALQRSSSDLLEAWNARQFVQRLVGPVPAWEQHPLRIWRDVEAILLRALELAGARPPGRGNWRVTSGPWKREGGSR